MNALTAVLSRYRPYIVVGFTVHAGLALWTALLGANVWAIVMFSLICIAGLAVGWFLRGEVDREVTR